MIYKQFRIGRFRGIADITVSLAKGDLVLLVGLNESGKTTILRALEAFDHRNDPGQDSLESWLTSVRNKSDEYTNKSATITADIEIARERSDKLFQSEMRPRPTGDQAGLIDDFLQSIVAPHILTITRVFPFKDGNAQTPYYRIRSDHALAEDRALADRVATRLIELCPFILYFEDFTDRIPERIYVAKSNDAYNPDWYDVIDGLFYNTRDNYSISKFKGLYGRANPRPDDARTVLRRVNATLNEVFTRKWEQLSGVKDIDETELIYNNTARSPYFALKVTDTDGTTYSVDERSKGALWYLSFLMKTEFRRRKMRKDSGKPIFLIDEPASNLHSSAQRTLLGDFRQLVEDTTVIYTTHSQYLISPENMRNTHVIRREGGTVRATLWSDYIRESAPLVTHYQPLADLLKLIPTSLDVPWDTAAITEGVSDTHVLIVMHRVLFRGADPTFVIYPGTSAFNLGSLISLNLGWQANFCVVLDDDTAGREARDRYQDEFGLTEIQAFTLPEDGKKIEDYFTIEEKKALYRLVFDRAAGEKVKKKEFAAMMAYLASDASKTRDVVELFGEATRTRFETLFARIRDAIGVSASQAHTTGSRESAATDDVHSVRPPGSSHGAPTS